MFKHLRHLPHAAIAPATPGGGKSACYGVLQAALTALGQQQDQQLLN